MNAFYTISFNPTRHLTEIKDQRYNRCGDSLAYLSGLTRLLLIVIAPTIAGSPARFFTAKKYYRSERGVPPPSGEEFRRLKEERGRGGGT